MNNLLSGCCPIPPKKEIPIETVRAIIANAYPAAPIQSIGEPHPWIMQSYRIVMVDGTRLLLKVGIIEDWTDASQIENHVAAVSVLRSIGVPQPSVLSFDASGTQYGFRYLLVEANKGMKLQDIYPMLNSKEREKLYTSLAHVYKKMHAKKNAWAGIWDGAPIRENTKFIQHSSIWTRRFAMALQNIYYQKGFWISASID